MIEPFVFNVEITCTYITYLIFFIFFVYMHFKILLYFEFWMTNPSTLRVLWVFTTRFLTKRVMKLAFKTLISVEHDDIFAILIRNLTDIPIAHRKWNWCTLHPLHSFLFYDLCTQYCALVSSVDSLLFPSLFQMSCQIHVDWQQRKMWCMS